MSASMPKGNRDIGNRPTPDTPPLVVLQTKGSRAPRLEALAVLRSQPEGPTMEALRRIAADPSDDATVRAAAIGALAAHGESIVAEDHPPASVAVALVR